MPEKVLFNSSILSNFIKNVKQLEIQIVRNSNSLYYNLLNLVAFGGSSMIPLKFCFCGSNDGRCKLKNGLIICHTHQHAKIGEVINGYECVKKGTFRMLGVVR